MERTEALAGAIASAERLAALRAEQAELTRKLGDSLALEAFAGRPIFDQGAVKSRVVGNVWRPEAASFELELGNGESLSWPLKSVPLRFWRGFAAAIGESRPDNHAGRRFLAAAQKKESNNDG
jgi:hypothetical protein